MATMTTTDTPTYEHIRADLLLMEHALKYHKLEKEQARAEAIQLAKEIENEVRGITLEFEVKEKQLERKGVTNTLVNLARRGKAKLIIAVQDLQGALIQKHDDLALRIISKIKLNDMYQKDAKRVASWWLAGKSHGEETIKFKVK